MGETVTTASRGTARSRHTGRVGLALLLVTLVPAASGCSSKGHDGTTTNATAGTTVPAPTPERFAEGDKAFFAVPDPIPAGTHGDLIRLQPMANAPDGSEWYRIMYLSTTVQGRPTVDTGVLTVPTGPAPADGWRLATHAHGSTGLADDCAPSRTVESDKVSALELTVVAADAKAHGYAVVSTDYEGQGGPGRHPFLVGVSEGRSVLDAARAAHGFPGLAIDGDDLAIVGYSQGGHAALWANQLATSWTPELHVLGTVAGAPASEVAALISAQAIPAVDNPQSLGIVGGLAAADPALASDLDRILTPSGKTLLAQMDASCTAPEGFQARPPYLSADPTVTEPWKSLMAANTPGAKSTSDPVLIIHSQEDQNVPAADSETLLKRLCRAGQVVERRVLPSGSHVAAAVPSYKQGFDWLDDLAKGVKPVSSCA